MVPELAYPRFVRETLISKLGVWEFFLDRKICLLEVSCLARSFSEEWGGKPPKIYALVSLSTSDRVKNETSSNLILLPPKYAPYLGKLS